MPNETRQRWDRLEDDCRLAGLPSPRLRPANFRDRWETSVKEWRFTGKDPVEAMDKMTLFLAGYSARMMVEQEAYDAAQEELTIQECCDRIIETNGLGGPSDHVLLAKAILRREG